MATTKHNHTTTTVAAEEGIEVAAAAVLTNLYHKNDHLFDLETADTEHESTNSDADGGTLSIDDASPTIKASSGQRNKKWLVGMTTTLIIIASILAVMFLRPSDSASTTAAAAIAAAAKQQVVNTNNEGMCCVDQTTGTPTCASTSSPPRIAPRRGCQSWPQPQHPPEQNLAPCDAHRRYCQRSPPFGRGLPQSG